MPYALLFLASCTILFNLSYANVVLTPEPLTWAENPNKSQSFVNSVDFHPAKNLCCVTHTHNHAISLYEIQPDETIRLKQVIKNPKGRLNCPQHAIFSPDGQVLVGVNWIDGTFNLYRLGNLDAYQETPYSKINPPKQLKGFKPHGMAFSPDGNLLGVCYGASTEFPRGIALFEVIRLNSSNPQFRLLHLLQTADIYEGVPKGITFSPDGTHLLITLANTDALHVYSLDPLRQTIEMPPTQIISGDETRLSRPEDVKLSADGTAIAVSNSLQDSITLYHFDSETNEILSPKPYQIIENPSASLSVPHGLSFSSDGQYLAVTQFGPVTFKEDGALETWAQERADRVTFFKIHSD